MEFANKTRFLISTSRGNRVVNRLKLLTYKVHRLGTHVLARSSLPLADASTVVIMNYDGYDRRLSALKTKVIIEVENILITIPASCAGRLSHKPAFSLSDRMVSLIGKEIK